MLTTVNMAMAPDWSLSLVHTTDYYSDKQDDTDHSPHHSTDIEGRPEGSEKRDGESLIYT